MCRKEVPMISTAAICDRTKCDPSYTVCYWQCQCRLSYATVCVTNVTWIKIHSKLGLCFAFTYSLEGELGSELHLPITHLNFRVDMLFCLTIPFPDVEYL